MDQKISPEEVAKLRQTAEVEINKRREIFKALKALEEGSIRIPDKLQMEILHRRKEDEMMRMLEGYLSAQKSYPNSQNVLMSAEAQLYLLKNVNLLVYRRPAEFMLANLHLSKELEHEYLSQTCEVSPNFSFWKRKYSSSGEIFMLSSRKQWEKKPANYVGCRMLREIYAPVMSYIKERALSQEAEEYLIREYLAEHPEYEAFTQVAEEVVLEYIKYHKELRKESERCLIKSGNHTAIMLYIEVAKDGLTLEDELLERGNREEVVAYFNRLVTLPRVL